MNLKELSPKGVLHYIKKNVNNEWITDAWQHAGITTLLGYLEDPFDKKGIAESCVEKYFNDPGSKYFCMPVDEIIQSWEASGQYKRNVGHLLDDYVFYKTGLYPNGEDLPGTLTYEDWKKLHLLEINDYVQSLFDAFDKFWEKIENKNYLIPVGREIRVGYVIADGTVVNGSIDFLLYDNKNKKLIILDWKTTENIKTKPDCLCHHLHGPLRELIDITITMYTLQTHFYKMCICESLNIDSEDVKTYVVQFLPTKMFNIYEESHDYDAALMRAALHYAFKERLKDKNAKKWDSSDTMRRTIANKDEIEERKRRQASHSKLKKLLKDNLGQINRIIENQ